MSGLWRGPEVRPGEGMRRPVLLRFRSAPVQVHGDALPEQKDKDLRLRHPLQLRSVWRVDRVPRRAGASLGVTQGVRGGVSPDRPPWPARIRMAGAEAC